MSSKVSKEREKSTETKFSKKVRLTINKNSKFSFYHEYWSLHLHILRIAGYENEHKITWAYNLATEKERKMNARFFQERKMSTAVFESASESAAHVSKKER